MSAKTTYQRSAKGPVAISECSADGRFIALENTGKRVEDLSGWRLSRNIDNDPKKKIEFTFASFTLRPSQKAKVWAGHKGPGGGPNDIETDIDSFGVGANITTKLINISNEVASLIKI